MLRQGFTLCRIGGVALVIQPLWIAIVAPITWSLGREHFPSEVNGPPREPLTASAC